MAEEEFEARAFGHARKRIDRGACDQVFSVDVADIGTGGVCVPSSARALRPTAITTATEDGVDLLRVAPGRDGTVDDCVGTRMLLSVPGPT